jgi:hypothetical protein
MAHLLLSEQALKIATFPALDNGNQRHVENVDDGEVLVEARNELIDGCALCWRVVKELDRWRNHDAQQLVQVMRFGLGDVIDGTDQRNERRDGMLDNAAHCCAIHMYGKHILYITSALHQHLTSYQVCVCVCANVHVHVVCARMCMCGVCGQAW